MKLWEKLSICDESTKKAMLYIKNKCMQNGVNKGTRFEHRNGASITITPCTYNPESTNWDDVDFWMTDCDKVYLPGYFELERVANVLLNLDEVIADNIEERKRLAWFREELEAMPECEDKELQFQMYSDAYKSCYGRRPSRNRIMNVEELDKE